MQTAGTEYKLPLPTWASYTFLQGVYRVLRGRRAEPQGAPLHQQLLDHVDVIRRGQHLVRQHQCAREKSLVAARARAALVAEQRRHNLVVAHTRRGRDAVQVPRAVQHRHVRAGGRGRLLQRKPHALHVLRMRWDPEHV
jgi:hypothetical protein